MGKKHNFFAHMMEQTPLGPELVPGQPIVEIAGEHRVLIENHQGVLSYAPNDIKIKVDYGCMIITGRDLQLMEMSRVKLAICGRIDGLQLLGR